MRATALLFVLVLLPAAAPAQVPAGAEFRVNTYTTSSQSDAVSASDARGNFVVVWQSLGQDGPFYGIHAQRFDASGAARGAEFRVNATTQVNQHSPAVAMTPGGAFVVAWEKSDGIESGVVAQRFDASGARRGAEIRVNAFTTGQQVTPVVAADAAGNFVVAWNGYGSSGYLAYYGIFARRFDSSGAPRGGGFVVNSTTTSGGYRPAIGSDAAGNFVVAWVDFDAGGSQNDILARRFDASGAPVGGDFQVNTYTTLSQNQAALAVGAGGSFVVAWEDYAGHDGNFTGVFSQRYAGGGVPSGAEFQVNAFATSLQRAPAIALDASGAFVIAWTSFSQDGSDYGIVARRFHASGAPRGAELVVNTYATGHQRDASVTGDGSGNFVVTWQSGHDASGSGVFGQRFGGLFPAALAVDTAGNGVLEPGEAVDVRPTWRNVTGAAQTVSGTLGPLSGPSGATYATTDASGGYGTVANGVAAPCTDCYAVSVSNPPTRPAAHWDAVGAESLAPDDQGQTKPWPLHVGASFTDVSLASPFYAFIETLLHHGVTGGCGAGLYCPASATTRAQMAVFALVAKEGAGFVPPACGAPVFGDVPAGSPFCPWIEELARRGVVGGCGNGNYCPGDAVTRAQMAVFALATLDPSFVPPACAPPNTFDDVPETSGFCPWIEELARRGIVAGCGGASYCPGAPVTRAQMGVFISGTFGLALYGP